MANKKRRRRKQGVVSWATSAIAIAIGLVGVIDAFKVGGLQGIANRASFQLSGTGKFDLQEGLRIYMPMVGAIIFKSLAGALLKKARLQSLVPSF